MRIRIQSSANQGSGNQGSGNQGSRNQSSGNQSSAHQIQGSINAVVMNENFATSHVI